MNVISACIISLHVWVGVYVDIPCLILKLSLYVGLRFCDVLFACSFLPVACPRIQIIISIGVYNVLCIGIFDVI
jgi:hypothetical protein